MENVPVVFWEHHLQGREGEKQHWAEGQLNWVEGELNWEAFAKEHKYPGSSCWEGPGG